MRTILNYLIKKNTNMKKNVFIFGLILLISSTLFSQNNTCSIEIQFPESTMGTVILKAWKKMEDGRNKLVLLDSSAIVKDKYKYVYDQIPEITMGYLFATIKDSIEKSISFVNSYYNPPIFYGTVWLDNSNTTIDINTLYSSELKDVIPGKIQNSPATDCEMMRLADFSQNHKFTNSSGEIINFDIIRQHPSNPRLLQIINESKPNYPIDSLVLAMHLFDTSLSKYTSWAQIENYIQNKKIFTNEGIASKFVFYDIKGEKYTFDKFIGNKKLGLIIFWASWCAPCIREIPLLKELYKKYGSNVSFVSLSVDTNKKDWEKALNKYPIEWNNLAGFSESNTKVSDVFGINAVPVFLLVDNKGNIIEDGIDTTILLDGKKTILLATGLSSILEKYINK